MTDFHVGGGANLRWLGQVYSDWRYAILFYSLLATLAAGPLFDALGIDANFLEVLLAANLLAAVIPLTPGTKRRLLIGLLIAACIMRFSAAWLDHSAPSAAGLILWTIIALLAAAGALRFAARAKSVDSEHLYAAPMPTCWPGSSWASCFGFWSAYRQVRSWPRATASTATFQFPARSTSAS